MSTLSASSGDSTVSVPKLLSSSSTVLDDVLSRSDVADYLRQFTEPTKTPKSVITFVERNMPKLLAVAQRAPADSSSSTSQNRRTSDPASTERSGNGEGSVSGGSSASGDWRDPTVASVNATELLAVYISAAGPRASIDKIVPVSLAALTRRDVLLPTVALSVQRLLLAAFDADFVKTTETITLALDEEVVQGAIRNLSQSSIVAETIIALFGSALSAVSMMAHTTRTRLFTAGWIQMRFPRHFIDYLSTAIRAPSHYNYFFFFREMLKRGFSHSAGPIVDVLLQKEYMTSLIDTILDCCEEEAEAAAAAASTKLKLVTPLEPSLTADALGILSAIVNLVRKSLITPETPEMYWCTVNHIAPIHVLDAHAKRFVALLECPANTTAAHHTAEILGMGRLFICEMFTEMALMHLSSTDQTLVQSGFLPAFIETCRRFPNNDTLVRLMHKCMLAIFSRPLLLGEQLPDVPERDLLMKHMIATEQAPNGVFTRLLQFGTDAEFKDTALAAFSLDLLSKLAELPLFSKEKDGPLAPLLHSFADDAWLQGRMGSMRAVITGDKFKEKGSAATGAVRHRPLINLVGEPLRTSLSISSPDENDGSPWGMKSGNSAANDDSTNTASSSSGGGSGFADGRSRRRGGSGNSRDDNLGPGSPRLFGPSASADLHAAEDHVLAPLDMVAIEKEIHALLETASPQMRAFPSFRSMQLGFSCASESEETTPSPTAPTTTAEAAAPTTAASAAGASPPTAAPATASSSSPNAGDTVPAPPSVVSHKDGEAEAEPEETTSATSGKSVVEKPDSVKDGGSGSSGNGKANILCAAGEVSAVDADTQ